MKNKATPGFRYMNEMVGSFILMTAAIGLVALFQTGQVRHWFDPGQTIKVLLPQKGLFGLAEGASVEILGTKAGSVTKIVIEPNHRLYAEIQIRRDFTPFVRLDSTAEIKKRFGVAGDAYLEISRGMGEPLDWDFPVIDAKTDTAPTETLQLMVDELRAQIMPAITEVRQSIKTWTQLGQLLTDPDGDMRQIIANTRSISQMIEKGNGVAHRLITDEELGVEVVDLVERLNANLKDVQPVIKQLEHSSKAISELMTNLSESSDEMPEIAKKVKASLDHLDTLLIDLHKTTKDLPKITKGAGDATEQLPALILQSQETIRELEQLIKQLQSNWLIGGDKQPTDQAGRLTPQEAMP